MENLQLHALIEVGLIDQKILNLKKKLHLFPIQLKDLLKAEENANNAYKIKEDQHQEKEKLRERLDILLNSLMERIKEADQKIAHSKNSQQFNAATREIENLKKELKKNEQAMIGLMEELEKETILLKADFEKLEGQRNELNLAKSKILSEQDEIKVEIESLSNERSKLVGNVSAPFLSHYERVLKQKGYLGIASVEKNKCGGCQIILPPQKVQLVLKGKDLIYCDSCFRILYAAEIANEKDSTLHT